MTSPYVTRSVPTTVATPTTTSGWLLWVKVLSVLGLVLSSLAAAALCALIAAIVYSGCFIGCSSDGGDHVAGLGLWALAVALLLGGPALSTLFWRRAHRPVTIAVCGAVGLVAVAVVAVPGLAMLLGS